MQPLNLLGPINIYAIKNFALVLFSNYINIFT